MTFLVGLDMESMSAECAVAHDFEVEVLHGACKRAGDIPMPTAPDVVLIRRCACPCHDAGGVR